MATVIIPVVVSGVKPVLDALEVLASDPQSLELVAKTRTQIADAHMHRAQVNS